MTLVDGPLACKGLSADILRPRGLASGAADGIQVIGIIPEHLVYLLAREMPLSCAVASPRAT
jgi:hypothetical protein